MLLQDSRIRELISLQPQIHFSVKDDEGWFGPRFPEGVDELEFNVVRDVKDVERLKLLYEFVRRNPGPVVPDQLCLRKGAQYSSCDWTALPLP